MTQTRKLKDGRLSIIAKTGVKYIPFELDEIGQEWVRLQQSEESISVVDLITMVLGGQARISKAASHAKFLKRMQDDDQMPLQLDFTQSFLSCEDTGEKNNLVLCMVKQENVLDLKLLSQAAASRYLIEKMIPITELSLDDFKELLEAGNFSQVHPTVKRIKHWFAGRLELWGLAYG